MTQAQDPATEIFHYVRGCINYERTLQKYLGNEGELWNMNNTHHFVLTYAIDHKGNYLTGASRFCDFKTDLNDGSQASQVVIVVDGVIIKDFFNYVFNVF